MTRQPDDYYATPAWVTRAILPHLKSPGSILDPAAGTGALLEAAWGKFGTADLHAIEIDSERFIACQSLGIATTCGDALSMAWPRADLILANPPYALALQFVMCACHHLRIWGTGQAAFLLRLAFLESKERNAFLRHRMPDKIKVLPRRPAFVNGKTDSCAYAWFVWGPEAHGEAAELSVLEVGK